MLTTMELGIVEILASTSFLFLCLYYYLTSTYDFWKKRGVKGPKPILIFGNFKDVALGRINLALELGRFYDQYREERFIGIFGRKTPLLILRDPELIKDVLIKDFSVFPDRSVMPSIKNDPFSQNLLNLEHKRWKPLRNKFTPVFSSGKLKDMFYLILECSSMFEKYVESVAANGKPIECRELTAKYTTDVIGTCAFGVNANSLGDENSGFRKAGRDLMDNSVANTSRRMLRDWFPGVYSLLRPFIYNRALDFFVKSMKDTMDYRKSNNERRNDFVDLLMDLRNQPDTFSDFEFDDSIMLSQALIFFLAGFETSSTTMSNALYELALHRDVQDKLRQEIKHVLEKHEKLTYDVVKSMSYLDKVVKESLRKYPPGSLLQRQSVTSYTFKGTNVTIPKNTKVIVPVWAIHRDPDLYPDPDNFDPERFDEEIAKARHPMNYLPFGDGPHNCIGLRFANFQSKVGIATLIKSFKVEVCEKTCIPYKVLPRSFIPAPVGGIYLIFSKV